jgi:hypothetical protein
MSGIITYVVNQYLSPFLQDFNDKTVDISLLSGEVTVVDAKLNVEFLTSLTCYYYFASHFILVI